MTLIVPDLVDKKACDLYKIFGQRGTYDVFFFFQSSKHVAHSDSDCSGGLNEYLH